MWNLTRVIDFQCPECVRRTDGEYVEEKHCVIGEGQTLEKAEYFCYLGDVLDCKGGVESAVGVRAATTWVKLRYLAGLLVNRIFHLLTDHL